ncbi:MAG: ABC transporter ATP-binding protein [Acidimicrobiia bacterium]
MLELAGVWAGYGPVRALAGVTLSVAEGTTVALLGRNGAGKTTTLRVASAMIRPQRGEVSFDGRPVRGLWTEDLVAAGLVHVPEGRGLFPHMSVGENLELGAHSARLSRRTAQARIADVLDYFPDLSDKLNRRTSTLSGGEQQMTAMARALMARPRLLLLDEPSLGLSPVVTQALYALLARLKREGLSMLLVEQYAELAAGIADRVYLLDKGHVAASGPPADVLAGEILEHTYMAHTTEAM